MSRLGGQWSQCDQILGELFGRRLVKDLKNATGFCNQIGNRDGKFMASPELVDQNSLAGLIGERVPPGHLDKKCEAVGESRIERFGTMIGWGVVGVLIRRGIHRRPAVAEFLE